MKKRAKVPPFMQDSFIYATLRTYVVQMIFVHSKHIISRLQCSFGCSPEPKNISEGIIQQSLGNMTVLPKRNKNLQELRI
jgi:hypothetical protein